MPKHMKPIKKGVDRRFRDCAFSAPPGFTSAPVRSRRRWRCDVKYGWIAVVAMMAALLSTGQVAAQYGPEEIGAEESPIVDPDTETEEPMSELEKLKAMEAESETPTVTGTLWFSISVFQPIHYRAGRLLSHSAILLTMAS